MKSIGFRMLLFLIFCPSLSQLALWTERIAVKADMVVLNSTTSCFLFLKISFAIFYVYLSVLTSCFACTLLMVWYVNKTKTARHTFNVWASA